MKIVLILIVAAIIWFLYRKFFPDGMNNGQDAAEFKDSDGTDTTNATPGGSPAADSSSGGSGGGATGGSVGDAAASAGVSSDNAETSDQANTSQTVTDADPAAHDSNVAADTNDYLTDDLADMDATAIFEAFASGDPLTDIPELMKVLNLRASDAPRLGISKDDFEQLKSGNAGALSTDVIDDVLKKLTGML